MKLPAEALGTLKVGCPVPLYGRQETSTELAFILLGSNSSPLQRAARFKALWKHIALFSPTPTRAHALASGGSQQPPPVFNGHREGRQSLSHSQQGEKQAQRAQGGEETCLILSAGKEAFHLQAWETPTHPGNTLRHVLI